MVKRPDTPPPAEEEPRILCITLPYPGVERIDFEGDGGTEVMLVHWLSLFIKKESLFYIYWMPKNDKILVSVAREKDGFYNNILGEHRWGAFVKDCSKENQDRVSTIYYSTYGHDRDVQRHGWRQKWIEASWFEDDYSEDFVNPYPTPKYTTRVSDGCRPIPRAMNPSAPPAGTTAWDVPDVPRSVPGGPSTSSNRGNNSRRRRGNYGQVGSLNYV